MLPCQSLVIGMVAFLHITPSYNVQVQPPNTPLMGGAAGACCAVAVAAAAAAATGRAARLLAASSQSLTQFETCVSHICDL